MSSVPESIRIGSSTTAIWFVSLVPESIRIGSSTTAIWFVDAVAVTMPMCCQEWQRSAQEAAGVLEGREAAVAGLAGRMERGLQLLGATAVEDRLQEGVPAAIANLLRAGLKVPVL